MFIITDHSTATASSTPDLASALQALKSLTEGTVCDQDGVIRAETRQGVYTPCNEHGFPFPAAHTA